MEQPILKRLLSLLLVVSLLIASFAIGVSAVPKDRGSDLPTVYVMGMGCPIITKNPDGSKHFIFPIEVDANEIMQFAADHIQVFLRAVATQQWDEFCDLLCEKIIPYFEEFKLGKDGEPTDGSVADFTWTRDSLRAKAEKLPTGQYSMDAFEFHYDFRLDPLQVADTLNTFIQDVMAVTGAEKVNLIGRCLGSNIVASYIYKYGHETIEQVLFLSSALLGATQCTKAFCGELYLDSDGIERYLYDTDLQVVNEITGMEDLDALLLSFITVFNDIGGLDFAAWSVNNVLPKIYLKIFPRILQNSFGTCPGFWSMVNDEDYLKAKETVFYDCDLAEYAGLIEKIDTYHYEVQTQADQLLQAVVADDIPVRAVAKYGLQTIPVTDHADELSDGLVYVHDSSFGATTMEVNRRFHRIYLNRAEKEGRLDFISPDLQIDASTCWFPMQTWFIKDLAHGDFPEGVYDLILGILNHPEMNVFDKEEFPQYLVYNKETDALDPMTGVNGDTTARWHVPFFRALVQFTRGLFRLIIRLIQDRRQAPNPAPIIFN